MAILKGVPRSYWRPLAPSGCCWEAKGSWVGFRGNRQVSDLWKPWKIHRKMGKSWKNHGKTMGKPSENGKIMEKPWENHRKMAGWWWLEHFLFYFFRNIGNNLIIPTDELIFLRKVAQPPASYEKGLHIYGIPSGDGMGFPDGIPMFCLYPLDPSGDVWRN